jgi:hypothetical protein
VNIQNIWRLEHVSNKFENWPTHIGFYTALNTFNSPVLIKLREIAKSKEISATCPIIQRYNKSINKTSVKGLPPTNWRHPRPGVFEDPFLREIAAKNYEALQKGPVFVFGFQSLEDADSWVEGEEFRKELEAGGFCYRRYRCGKVHHGLRQSIAMLDSTIEKTSEVHPIIWDNNSGN